MNSNIDNLNWACRVQLCIICPVYLSSLPFSIFASYPSNYIVNSLTVKIIAHISLPFSTSSSLGILTSWLVGYNSSGNQETMEHLRSHFIFLDIFPNGGTNCPVKKDSNTDAKRNGALNNPLVWLLFIIADLSIIP